MQILIGGEHPNVFVARIETPIKKVNAAYRERP